MNDAEIKTDYRKFRSDCYRSCTFLTIGNKFHSGSQATGCFAGGERASILPPDPLNKLRPAAAFSFPAAMLFYHRSLFVRKNSADLIANTVKQQRRFRRQLSFLNSNVVE